MTQVIDAAPVAFPTASKRRTVTTLACTAVVAVLSWATFYLLQSLPWLSPDGKRLLYYAGGHTSTWWSVPTFALAALASLVLTGQLGRLAWRSSRAAVPTAVHVVVAVLASAVWVCGAAFFVLFNYILLFGPAAEGTQQTVHGPDGAPVLVTRGGIQGDSYDVWLPVSDHTYLQEPGRSELDPRHGPCTVTGTVGTTRVVTCGDLSQTLTR